MQTGTIVTSEGPRIEATLKTGAMNVTTAGTAVSLGAITGIREVIIQAKRTNGGIIFVGPSTVLNNDTNGIYLSKGEALHLYCTSLAEVFINSTVNGEGVTFLYW
jgi:hypothetical protein